MKSSLYDSDINYDIGSSRKIPGTNYILIVIISIILIVVVLTILHNISLNKISDIQDVIIINDPTKELLQEKIKARLPIIINGMIIKDDLLYDLQPHELRDGNPDYLLKTHDKICSFAEFIAERKYIYNNPEFINDFKMGFRVKRLLYGFDLDIHCSKKYLFNMFMKKTKLKLECNSNNLCIILQLNGAQTINLFHPEYSEDIKDLGEQIWSSSNDDINDTLTNVRYLQLVIKSGQILYIPPLWRWCSIVSDSCVYVKYTCDSYFTTLINRIKNI